jgi:transposase
LGLAKKRQFGSSSEKLQEGLMDQLSLSFNELEAYAYGTKSATPEQVAVKAHARKKQSGSVTEIVPEGTPTEVVEHRLSEEELICSACGSKMEEIGKEVRRSLQMEPARFWIREDVYYTYACRKCEQDSGEANILKTPKEPALLPGSYASAEAVAHIAVQKFVMYSPLYRLEQEFHRQGLKLSRQTMSNWILRAAEEYLAPVYEQLHRELLGREVLHADETTLQVLREPGRAPQSESYMWLYRTGADTDRPIVLYEYQPGRGAKHPKAFLAGFRGYLHTDGYAGYHSLPEEITVVGCWAHARRKFDEAVKSLPKGKAKSGSAAQGLAYCSKLFELEQSLSDLSPQERYLQRLEQEKPVLDAFLAWANTRTAAPKSALGKALTYLKEQWPYLVNYLRDGRLEISNNRAERSIKPFVIDRKNFLFANTPKGATGSAVIFSMIQTALENQLDPYRYLTWLLQTACGLDMADPAVIQKLLPWQAPDICKAK